MATVTPNLQNLAVEWGVQDDPNIIIDLVKASGILQTALVLPSSHGNKHKYKYFNSLPTSAFRALGTGIVPSEISKDRAAIDLWDLSALAEEDAQEILQHPGGKAGWLAANMGAFLESMGQAAAKQILYGTTSLGGTTGFVGLHQYAVANSTAVNQATATASSTCSIVAVRWDASNGASLRINPTTGGNLITTDDITPVNPALVVTNTTTNAQLPVFAWWLHAFFSLIIPSAASVACIKCVDATHAPTATQMNNMIDMVEKNSGNVVIYANKIGRTAIASLKSDKLNLFNETMDYNQYLATWRGCPIILEENIVNTESTAVLG